MPISPAPENGGEHAAAERPWFAGISAYQWLVLLIACLGWIFDVFEGQIYEAVKNEAWPVLLPGADAGMKAFYNNLARAAFLVGGALGGVAFGVLSDRIGRVRTMMFTILMYSSFTCLTAFAQNAWHMIVLRLLVAAGVGGEWAVASAMVAEVFPQRARAWSLGIFHASSIFGLYAAVLAGWLIGTHPALGWRWCFAVGLAPALLTAWIYTALREPQPWIEARLAAREGRTARAGRLLDLFTPQWIRATLVGLALATVGLATFWGVYVEGWNLVRELEEDRCLGDSAATLDPEARRQAVAALSAHDRTAIQRTQMAAMFLVSTGGGLGLVSCGPLANRLGRRGAFLFFCLGGMAAALVLFQLLPLGPLWLLWTFLPVFGYFGTGMHAGYAIYFPELFPTRLRGTGSGFCFNGGRLLAAPILIVSGWLQKDVHMTLGATATVLSLLFLLGVVVLLFAPETKGRELPA
jgi:MFS family permease